MDWNDESQRQREGVDLRGADLHDEDLSRLPLACMYGGLNDWTEWLPASDEQREAAAIHLEIANLHGTHLEGATLGLAHLKGASLAYAHLENVSLFLSHLEKARLYHARLEGADLTSAHKEICPSRRNVS